MKSFVFRLIAVLSAGLVALAAHAQERGSKAEATTMVDGALALIKAAGADKAAHEFMSEAKWKVKDLYVSMYLIKDGKVTVVAHGVNEKLVGKDISDLKDADGKPFIREAVDKIAKGGGWVDYKWPDPATKKVSDKTSYVKGLAGTDYGVLVGIYK